MLQKAGLIFLFFKKVDLDFTTWLWVYDRLHQIISSSAVQTVTGMFSKEQKSCSGMEYSTKTRTPAAHCVGNCCQTKQKTDLFLHKLSTAAISL